GIVTDAFGEAADLDAGNDFARGGIDHRNAFALGVADIDVPAISAGGDAIRMFADGDGGGFIGGSVDDGDRVGVHVDAVKLAAVRAQRNAERMGADRHALEYLQAGGIDHSHVVAVAVGDIQALAVRADEQAGRRLADGNFATLIWSGGVDHQYAVVEPVG